MAIIVVDQHDKKWREGIARALIERRCKVIQQTTYDTSFLDKSQNDIEMIVIGCVLLGAAEKSFIRYLLYKKARVMVYASELTRTQLSDLMRMGARSAELKSYDINACADEIVQQIAYSNELKSMPFIVI